MAVFIALMARLSPGALGLFIFAFKVIAHSSNRAGVISFKNSIFGLKDSSFFKPNSKWAAVSGLRVADRKERYLSKNETRGTLAPDPERPCLRDLFGARHRPCKRHLDGYISKKIARGGK